MMMEEYDAYRRFRGDLDPYHYWTAENATTLVTMGSIVLIHFAS
jgi:hypothetical protein